MIVQTSTKPAPVQAPSFATHAANIVKAYGKFDKASAKFSAELSLSMNQYIDAVRVTPGIGKDEASCKAVQKAIREAEAFQRAVRDGLLESKTITEYAQGAARALHHGVAWEPTLKNDPDKALPWSKKAKGSAATKAGKVESTDRAALDATLAKALKQARLLGLVEFAASVLDLAIESLDGFKEPTEQ